MLASGPSGFYNAPVSKAIFVVSGVSSLAMSVLVLNGRRGVVGTLWSHVSFATSSEVLFSSLLFYSLRLLERQFGSNKFASLIAVSSLLSAIVCALLPWRSAHGPYAPLFSALVVYAYHVPVTVRVRILGLGISDKLVLYFLAAQLLWSQFPRSLTPAFAGILAGILYRSDDLPFKTWRFPATIVALCERIFMPFLVSKGPVVASASLQSRQSQHHRSDGAPPVHEYTAEQQEAQVVISEDSVATLVSMGFERERVIIALRRSGGSVEQAASSLLG
ncbi:hypothetical protein BC830DRAFT_1164955 [Chytriomyces sp. MP71]|nr:hypothetical protein BC830DRAFT_1164955 [Chytriomyces sp. MP71]